MSGSILIEDRTRENRWLFLFLRFFLELCGHTVLEDRTGGLGRGEEGRFRRIVIEAPGPLCTGVGKTESGAAPPGTENAARGIVTEKRVSGAPGNSEEKIIISPIYSTMTALEKLSQWLSADDGELRAMTELAVLYESDREIFRSLYTVSCLYFSRNIIYPEAEKLKDAARKLAAVCNDLEKELELEADACNWRKQFAGLYLADRVNECMSKLRGYQYRSYDVLEKRLEKLQGEIPLQEEFGLLKAEILRNTRGSYLVHARCYREVRYEHSLGVEFYSQYALGELEQEKADEAYKGVFGDELCEIMARIYEPLVPYCNKCLQIKPDEIRVLYKLGLQEERKGLTDAAALTEAGRLFEELKQAILSVSEAQRTTLEFDYLYKTYIRLGNIRKLQRDYTGSRKEFRMAEEIWERMGNYFLFAEIYGAEEQKSIEGILDKKYEYRQHTFDANKRDLDRLQGLR